MFSLNDTREREFTEKSISLLAFVSHVQLALNIDLISNKDLDQFILIVN